MDVIVDESLSSDPLEALRELAQGETKLDRLRLDRVRAAREQGRSWEEIGAALGMSKQSAWEYFTRRARSELSANAGANDGLSEADAMSLAVGETRSVRRRRAQ